MRYIILFILLPFISFSQGKGAITTNTEPTTNQVLIYNGTEWVPTTSFVDSTHIKVGGIELEGLSRDGATVGQVLKLSGTNWVPSSDLTDVVSSLAFDPVLPLVGWVQPAIAKTGDALNVKFTDCKVVQYRFNGTNWAMETVSSVMDLDKTTDVTLPTLTGTGWAGTGTYTHASALPNELFTNIALDNDATYLVSFTASSVTAGAIYAQVGGGFSKTSVNSNGNYSFFITTFEEDRVSFRAGTEGFFGTISNITLKKVVGCDFTVHTPARFMGPMYLESGRIITPQTARIAIGYNSSPGITWDDFGYDVPGSSINIGTSAGNRGSQTSVGYFSGHNNQEDGVLTSFGKGAGQSNTTGHACYFGNYAGWRSTTTDSHVFGDEAGSSLVTGSPISAFGYYSLNQANGTNPMSAFGHESLRFATTGPNTGMGYFAGRGVTTGRVTVMGNRAGEFMTTGNGMFFGSLAGTKPGDTDFSFKTERGVMILGDSIWKTDSGVMDSVIIVGHGLKADRPHEMKLGYKSNKWIEMYGRFGLGKAPDPLYNFDVLSNLPNIQGMRFTNASTDPNASVDMVLTNPNGEARWYRTASGIQTFQNTTGYTRFFQLGALGYRFSVNSADKYFLDDVGLGINTQPTAPLDVVGAAKVSSNLTVGGNSTVTGNSFVGGNTMLGSTAATPLERLHMQGNYLRIGHMGANGGEGAPSPEPIPYGVKFFANNDALEQGRIESLNSLQNILRGRFRFSLANSSGVIQEVVIMDGGDKSLTIQNLTGTGDQLTYANSAGKVIRSNINIADISSTDLDEAYNNFAATASKVTVDATEGQTGGLEFESTGANNIFVDLQGTGDFSIQDAGANRFEVNDAGYSSFGTLAPNTNQRLLVDEPSAGTSVAIRATNSTVRTDGGGTSIAINYDGADQARFISSDPVGILTNETSMNVRVNGTETAAFTVLGDYRGEFRTKLATYADIINTASATENLNGSLSYINVEPTSATTVINLPEIVSGVSALTANQIRIGMELYISVEKATAVTINRTGTDDVIHVDGLVGSSTSISTTGGIFFAKKLVAVGLNKWVLYQ